MQTYKSTSNLHYPQNQDNSNFGQTGLNRVPSQQFFSNRNSTLQSPMKNYQSLGLMPMSYQQTQQQLPISGAQKKKLERDQRIKQEQEELLKLQNYNPYGKGGSGAPMRDNQGNIITVRKVGFTENITSPNSNSNRPLNDYYQPQGSQQNSYNNGGKVQQDYNSQPPPMDAEEKRRIYDSELRQQIKEKNDKVSMAKRQQKQQDIEEERKIKEDLDLMNQKERQIILKEKGKSTSNNNSEPQTGRGKLASRDQVTKNVTINDKNAISPPSYEPIPRQPDGYSSQMQQYQQNQLQQQQINYQNTGQQNDFVMDGNRGMIHLRSEVQVGLGQKSYGFQYDTQRQGYDPRDIQMKQQQDQLNQQLMNLRSESEKIKQGTRTTEIELQRVQDHISSKNDWHSYYEQEFSKALKMPLFNKNRQEQRKQVQFQNGSNYMPSTAGSAMSGVQPDYNQQNKWVNLLQNKSQAGLSRQTIGSREREFPSSKGHALRSAAATLFDGKPPMNFLNQGANWDMMAGNNTAGGFNELITDTKIVPIDQYKSVYNPQFDKVEDESFNIDQGVGARMIAKDREYFDQADEALREIEELNKLSEVTHFKEETNQLKRYASQAQLNQKMQTMEVTNYKQPKIASYKGIQNRIKKANENGEDVRNSLTLFKDLLNQPLMNHNGTDYDPQALSKMMDEREFTKMEGVLKQKQLDRLLDYEKFKQDRMKASGSQVGSRMNSRGEAKVKVYQTDNTLKQHNAVNIDEMLKIKQQKEDEDYWGRDIASKTASEREFHAKLLLSGKNDIDDINAGGGFISGMYDQSLKNFSELIPPIETSKLDFE
eukprot:403370161